MHDNAELLPAVKTKGVGFKRVCAEYGHTWYINKKIKTAGCLTCKGTRRRSLEHKMANWDVPNRSDSDNKQPVVIASKASQCYNFSQNAELCSGSTGDFGSSSPGSNPGSAATNSPFTCPASLVIKDAGGV